MATRFYINSETHEIHVSSCDHGPVINKVYLGTFETKPQAKSYALNNGYDNADGCAFCCSEIHTK